MKKKDIKDVVLIASVGTTDLQVIVHDCETNQDRGAHIGRGVRGFHEWLLADKTRYTLVDELPSGMLPKGHDLNWDSKSGELVFSNCIPREEGKAVKLFPAKLIPVTDMIDKEKYEVKGAIIFNTARDADCSFANKEPVAAGPILAEWIAEKYQLKYNGNKTGYEPGWAVSINILDGKMELTGNQRDIAVNREAVRRIDKAVKDAHDEHGDEIKILITTSGGFPVFKNIIPASARLRFDYHNVHSFVVPEDYKPGDKLKEDPDTPTPSDSLITRRHAISLIKGGNFAGALAVSKIVENDVKEKKWVQLIRRVNQFIIGRKLQPFDGQDYIKDIKDAHPGIRSLKVAFRAESSLKTGNITEALSLTFTFYDSAMLDFIQYLLYPGSELKEVNRLIIIPDGIKVKEELVNLNEKLFQPCMDKCKGNKYQYSLMGYEKDRIWREVIGSKSLDELNTAMHTKIETQNISINIRDLRNINAHSQIDEDMLSNISEVMVKAGLWNSQKQSRNPGDFFIRQDLIKNVLQEFEITDPGLLYQNMVDGLIKDLLNYEIY